MIQIRRSSERGHIQEDWLDTFHTFSFSAYQDPRFMGFRSLRVINEDRLAPAEGFPSHSHEDMEILTYIISGSLEHKDSMGNGSVIRPGDVQYMSAGSGVTHSEFNASKTETVHLLQIWILPEKTGEKPAYGQKNFGRDLKKDRFCLMASPSGAEGSIRIRQDAYLFSAELQPRSKIERAIGSGRFGWLQVVRGELVANGEKLGAGDGLALTEESRLTLEAQSADGADVLFFDLV